MSMQTADNFVYEDAKHFEKIDKPFLKRSGARFVYDNNVGSSYSGNQVVFEVKEFSFDQPDFPNYKEAYMSFPMVIVLNRTDCAAGAASDWRTIASDAIIAMKNSHLNLLHSINIEYKNSTVVQTTNYINSYLIFKQHSEMSIQDEEINGPTIGYSKDSSTSWGYYPKVGAGVATQTAPDGTGLCNNYNPSVASTGGLVCEGEIANEGMIKRQRYLNKIVHNGALINGRGKVLRETTDDFRATNTAMNYIVDSATSKAIFYDVIIRLKDIPFFQDFPLCKADKVKIILNLNNNIKFSFRKNALGAMIYEPNSFVNNSGMTNPLMISASHTAVVAHPAASGVACADGAAINAALVVKNPSTVVYPCGSSCLLNADATLYTVQMAIANLSVTSKDTAGSVAGSVTETYNHIKTKCRLYIPQYQFESGHQVAYLANPVHTLNYIEVAYQAFRAEAGGSFSAQLTSGLARMKRLVMIGILDADQNEGVSPFSSPFTTEPSTTSPFLVRDFQVSFANGVNLYDNTFNYSYEHFLTEMNGNTGINCNHITGATSSRISQVDFNNNYHYLVADLSRRLPEGENIAQSLSVTGTLASLKNITFHCYIEYVKTIQIDVKTGALVE